MPLLTLPVNKIETTIISFPCPKSDIKKILVPGNRTPESCHQRCVPCPRMFTATSVVDPWHFGTDPDQHHCLTGPDPAFFVSGWQDANKKYVLFSKYFCLLLLPSVHLYQFSEIKSRKKSQNCENQVFLYFYCLLMEGSWSEQNNDVSGRPKNIRIRIRNTANNSTADLRILLPSLC